MGGLADLPLGLLHAENITHGPVEPWPRIGKARPFPFIESAQNKCLRPDQARFQKAEDGKPRRRLSRVAQGHELQLMANGEGGAGKTTIGKTLRLLLQCIKQQSKCFCFIAHPELWPGNAFGHFNQDFEMPGKCAVPAPRQGAENVRHLLKTTPHLLPVTLIEPAHEGMQMRVCLGIRCNPVQGLQQPFKTTAHGRCAQQGQLDIARGVEKVWSFQIEPCQRMAEQGRKAWCRKICLNGIHEQNQKCGCAKADERLAGRIIDMDIPACERCFYPACQIPVWRHQGNVTRWFFQLAPHDERNDRGLFILVAGLKERNLLKTCLHRIAFAGQCDLPFISYIRGSHKLACQPRPRAGLSPESGNGETLNPQLCNELL